MRVNQFIDVKSKQLCFYINAFLNKAIDYKELDIFLWEMLEEWAHVTQTKNESYSEKERVFWHLVHQLNFWEQDVLLNDNMLVEELMICCDYLDGTGCFPMDCIGVRP